MESIHNNIEGQPISSALAPVPSPLIRMACALPLHALQRLPKEAAAAAAAPEVDHFSGTLQATSVLSLWTMCVALEARRQRPPLVPALALQAVLPAPASQASAPCLEHPPALPTTVFGPASLAVVSGPHGGTPGMQSCL